MLFKVTMDVQLPHTMPKESADALKAAERELAQSLQRSGKWRHLWRVAGRYANVSIFDVSGAAELHELLTSLPLFPYMKIEVEALCRHPSSIHDDGRPLKPTAVSPETCPAARPSSPPTKRESETNMDKQAIDAVLRKIQGAEANKEASRVQQIVNRIVHDLFHTIEDFDVQPEEFWSAMHYLTEAGRNGEYGLIAAGLGLEHFLDLRSDEAEARAGVTGGTPRTIEGPLYVAGAPEEKGFARLDQDAAARRSAVHAGPGARHARQAAGQCAGGSLACQPSGRLLLLDPGQSPFNLRRSIRTDADGRLPLPLARAGRLQRAARRLHRQADEAAGPPRHPSGAHPLLRVATGLSQADHADQHRGRSLSVG
ncbi:MAG: muconolactone Delta-isomerase [Nibricoccus sp.]